MSEQIKCPKLCPPRVKIGYAIIVNGMQSHSLLVALHLLFAQLTQNKHNVQSHIVSGLRFLLFLYLASNIIKTLSTSNQGQTYLFTRK